MNHSVIYRRSDEVISNKKLKIIENATDFAHNCEAQKSFSDKQQLIWLRQYLREQ